MSDLSENEARFLALVNATLDMVYRMSPDWRSSSKIWAESEYGKGSAFIFELPLG